MRANKYNANAVYFIFQKIHSKTYWHFNVAACAAPFFARMAGSYKRPVSPAWRAPTLILERNGFLALAVYFESGHVGA